MSELGPELIGGVGKGEEWSVQFEWNATGSGVTGLWKRMRAMVGKKRVKSGFERTPKDGDTVAWVL